tara:strand:- start:1006 stop:1158 length:153 start_codon:yes stop_codon:yes gene_type:complete
MKKTIKDNWDPNDWQGRSKQQYESSAVGAFISLLGFAIIITYYIIFKFLF